MSVSTIENLTPARRELVKDLAWNRGRIVKIDGRWEYRSAAVGSGRASSQADVDALYGGSWIVQIYPSEFEYEYGASCKAKAVYPRIDIDDYDPEAYCTRNGDKLAATVKAEGRP